ncbi:MAG: hypothetical protein WA843_02585 [Candidatus Saccharimonadales bacterium]
MRYPTELGFHNENLFDQDERNDGGRVNEATGNRYDNSTFRDEDLFTDGSKRQVGYVTEDGVGELPLEAMDADQMSEEQKAIEAYANALLAEHDVEKLPNPGKSPRTAPSPQERPFSLK